ncbi:hypothetical protein, partial [Burkholderia sp. MSMB1078WGS]|uniref:hypothetical protein n=1 Tax=Burkholderia sp. MSMB1078WGS TaxID=1637900 RepID=UPI00211D96AF
MRSVFPQSGDQSANLPGRQFQPFRRTPWFELAVGYVLNDLESVQLAHRHRDPFRCSHRSLRRWIASGRSACDGSKNGHLNLAGSGHLNLAATIHVIPGFRCPPSSHLKMSGFKVGFAAF